MALLRSGGGVWPCCGVEGVYGLAKVVEVQPLGPLHAGLQGEVCVTHATFNIEGPHRGVT